MRASRFPHDRPAQPALATELLGAGPSPPSRQPPRGPLSSRVSPHARPSPLRSFEQAVDPIQTDSVSAAESLRVFRSGAPDAVVRAPHDTPRQVQHDRLSLQRRAPSTLRRHLARAVGRFAVLLTADLAAFAILRELYRSVGEEALLGDWLSNTVQQLLPAGYLDGWQYALALVLGLIVTGNYGAGDRRRDAARLFWGCAFATALPLWTRALSSGPRARPGLCSLAPPRRAASWRVAGRLRPGASTSPWGSWTRRRTRAPTRSARSTLSRAS